MDESKKIKVPLGYDLDRHFFKHARLNITALRYNAIGAYKSFGRDLEQLDLMIRAIKLEVLLTEITPSGPNLDRVNQKKIDQGLLLSITTDSAFFAFMDDMKPLSKPEDSFLAYLFALETLRLGILVYLEKKLKTQN